jgi:hypothetical protein
MQLDKRVEHPNMPLNMSTFLFNFLNPIRYQSQSPSGLLVHASISAIPCRRKRLQKTAGPCQPRLFENGRTVVIGGIYIQEEMESVNKVPMFGDVPVVGNLLIF